MRGRGGLEVRGAAALLLLAPTFAAGFPAPRLTTLRHAPAPHLTAWQHAPAPHLTAWRHAPAPRLTAWRRPAPAATQGGATRLVAWDFDLSRDLGEPRFGRSLAATAEVLLVGAPRDGNLGPAAGAAYLFRRVGARWRPEAKLLASDGAAGHRFGAAVALAADGSTAVVGAFFADGAAPMAGAVYVFEPTPRGWVESAKLAAADGDLHDGFGDALALEGERLLVGASYADVGGFLTGAAYLFERGPGGTVGPGGSGGPGWLAHDGWTERAKLTSGDPGFFAGFGSAVALEGDALLVGAPRADAAGTDAGAVYRFVPGPGPGGWVLAEQLLPPFGPAAGAAFGTSLALRGSRLAVGAPGARMATGATGLGPGGASGAAAGAVFLFDAGPTGWASAAVLFARGAEGLGASVALGRGALLAGAPAAGGAALSWVASAGGWLLERRLSATSPGGQWGAAVAWSGRDIVVGAPRDDPLGGPNGWGAGVVWLFGAR